MTSTYAASIQAPAPSQDGASAVAAAAREYAEVNGVAQSRWDSFWSRVEFTDTCWLWRGARDGSGRNYGRFYLAGRVRPAHRISYQWIVGPIPDILDHLCRVKHCINPDHLEPVDKAENGRRAIGLGEPNRSKTHCPLGHPYSGSNLIVIKPGRQCRACNILAKRRFRERRKAAAA